MPPTDTLLVRTIDAGGFFLALYSHKHDPVMLHSKELGGVLKLAYPWMFNKNIREGIRAFEDMIFSASSHLSI